MGMPTLQLTGEDGNAFAILGRARKAWFDHNFGREEWEEIKKEAISGNYDHLLQTMMKYFDVT